MEIKRKAGRKTAVFFYIIILLTGIFSCRKPESRVVHIAPPVSLKPSLLESRYQKPAPSVDIYLPDNYSRVTNRYPVLYMHDGQNLGNWKIEENVNQLMDAGLLEPLIIVGIHHRGSKRIDDYTPTLADDEEVKREGGNWSNFARFLVEELKPLIDRRYRTLPEREHTGVMGSSLGGLSSFYLIGKYPAVFSRAGVISPSFWWDGVRVTNDIRDMEFRRDVKIYIDGGWREGADESSMIDYMRLVREKLAERGLKDFEQVYYYEDPDGTHDEMNWAKRGKMPLLFLFGKFDAASFKPAEVRLQPEILEVGRTCSAVLEWEGNDHMRATVFAQDWSVDNPAIVDIRHQHQGAGYLTGLRTGRLFLGGSALGRRAVKTVEVYPSVAGRVNLIWEVGSEEKVNGITVSLKETSGGGLSRTVNLNWEETGKWTGTFSAEKGKKISFSLIDDRGRKAYADNDKEIEKVGLSQESRIYRIKVTSWK